jgi:hypothetical protein
MNSVGAVVSIGLVLGAQAAAARTPASAITLRGFRLEPAGILFGIHPTEARIVVSAVTAAPLKVCQLGTTFSRNWKGGCRRLAGGSIALPTSGGAVHIGFRLLPANGHVTRLTTLSVRWHCVDHYFALLRGNTRVRVPRAVFDC